MNAMARGALGCRCAKAMRALPAAYCGATGLLSYGFGADLDGQLGADRAVVLAC